MFQKRYIDEDDWQNVSEDLVKDNLSRFYNNVNEVIEVIKEGATVRTPFAYFKYIK